MPVLSTEVQLRSHDFVPPAAKPIDKEASALHRTVIAYSGKYRVKGDNRYFDVVISWNESWNGTRQVRTVKIESDKMTAVADTVNPTTSKPAIHKVTFEREKS